MNIRLNSKPIVGLLLSFCVVFLVAGCHTIPAQVDEAKLSHIRHITIVSIAGHRFWNPVTSSRGERYHDVSAWGLNEHWEQVAATAAKGSRFEIVPKRTGQDTLAKLYGLDRSWNVPAERSSNWRRLEDALKSVAVDTGADAIVLLVPTANYVFDLSFDGLGFAGEPGLFSTTTSTLALYADLFLVDGKSGKPISGFRVCTAYTGVRGGDEVWVQRGARKEIAKTPFHEWTPEQTAEIRDLAYSMADNALAATVKHLLKAN